MTDTPDIERVAERLAIDCERLEICGGHLELAHDIRLLLSEREAMNEAADMIAAEREAWKARATQAIAEKEAAEAERDANISLDTLPFWPWLWADPFRDDPDEQEQATERRVRVNYETARAPVPNQYALLHRADIQRLVHALWRKRALQGLIDAWKAEKEASEARALSAEQALAEAVEGLEPFAKLAEHMDPMLDGRGNHHLSGFCDDAGWLRGQHFRRASALHAKLSGRLIESSSVVGVPAAPDGATETQHSAAPHQGAAS